MSRSYKKPFGPVARGSSMKKWRSESNRIIRRDKRYKDISDGNAYKKINDVWGSPSDGKMYYGESPRFKRK